MNELQFTNAYGLRLIQEFEGEPRLAARLCEGGRYELGYGITFDLDGQPFTATSTCTPDYADALFRNALKFFEDGVRRLVTVPLNSNQFSGLVALAWNIGLENFRSSTVLRRVNEGRMEDAAASFGMWVFATKGGHKQALRGLLRRRYSEAALFLGYSWTEACDNDAIALQREIPASLPGTDRVIYKTAFKDVLAVAQRYPLPPLDDELVLSTPIQPAPATSVIEARGNGAGAAPAQPVQPPVPQKTSASGSSEATPVKPTVPAPQPPVARPAPASAEAIKPPPLPKDAAPASIEPKDMLLSKRAWGLAVTAVGTTQFIPRGASEWLNNEGNRELLSWLIVVIIGVLLYQYGKYKAKRPLK